MTKSFRQRKQQTLNRIRKTRYELNMLQTICGECQECCKVIGVHELNKPKWEECQYQCSSGCAIHDNKPESCKKYYCLYQGGILDTDVNLRPDKLGIILDLRGMTSENINVITAWETREGAADKEDVLKILKSFASNSVVYVRRYKSKRRTILGPPHILKDLIIEEFD